MQAVQRIVALLTVVSDAPDGLTLTEIAREVDLSPATCFRMLGSLVESRYLERDRSTRKYYPGIGLMRLASAVQTRDVLHRNIDALLSRLRDRWQECFFVATLINSEIVCTRGVETTDPTRMGVFVPIGRRLPAPSASAKAIIGFRPADEQRALIRSAGLERFTPETKTRLADVLADLVTVRQRRLAICDQEMEIGVAAFAVPITVGAAATTQSLGVVGPRDRLFSEVEKGLIDELLATARSISGHADGEV